jgi:olefin beta-lactone synthetase
VSRQDAEAFAGAFSGTALDILYGSTEVEPIAHLAAAEMPTETGRGVCLGLPSAALALRFIRPTCDPVTLGPDGWAPWEVPAQRGGELLGAGRHVGPGYFRPPDACARAQVVDGEGRAWHRTGDVCTRDGAGRLWMLGRVHNAIRRGDDVLFPMEAELLMGRLPFVGSAAYLGISDPALHEAAWAVFTLVGDASADEARHAIATELARAEIPVDRVVRVAAIPMDPRHHSKVDVDALRALLLAGGASAR